MSFNIIEYFTQSVREDVITVVDTLKTLISTLETQSWCCTKAKFKALIRALNTCKTSSSQENDLGIWPIFDWLTK